MYIPLNPPATNSTSHPRKKIRSNIETSLTCSLFDKYRRHIRQSLRRPTRRYRPRQRVRRPRGLGNGTGASWRAGRQPFCILVVLDGTPLCHQLWQVLPLRVFPKDTA